MGVSVFVGRRLASVWHRAARRTHSGTFYRATAADVQQFHEDGFIVARGFLSAEENHLVRRALELDSTLVHNTILLNDDSHGQTKLALWSNPGNGTLGMYTRSARVMGTMEALLGGPVTHYHSKQLLKEPQAGGVWNWHQDYGYWYKDYFLTPDMATCYLAVDPQNERLNNGALKLLRGSHKMGRVDHWSKGDQQGADLERVVQGQARYEEVVCDLEAGDAVFFHSLTLHASPGNLSDARRLAFGAAWTLSSNLQYKDAYIPCVACEQVSDAAIMQSMTADGMPTLTDAADKQMLDPDEGVERARKDGQN